MVVTGSAHALLLRAQPLTLQILITSQGVEHANRKGLFPQEVLAEERTARLRIAVLDEESDDRKQIVRFCSATITPLGTAMCLLTSCPPLWLFTNPLAVYCPYRSSHALRFLTKDARPL